MNGSADAPSIRKFVRHVDQRFLKLDGRVITDGVGSVDAKLRSLVDNGFISLEKNGTYRINRAAPGYLVFADYRQHIDSYTRDATKAVIDAAFLDYTASAEPRP